MRTDIPTAVWEGSFRLFGVDVKCYALSDGQRIIDADDFGRLMEAMGATEGRVEMGDIDGFNRWRMGID